ncbi:unnamed protein product [Calicophoron daubneyi]|uniref:Uncharacterized protein n=1 Tax=Calicophoron daubneyi TaxID=300641 RepID=A0AAV2T3H9_CALDB
MKISGLLILLALLNASEQNQLSAGGKSGQGVYAEGDEALTSHLKIIIGMLAALLILAFLHSLSAMIASLCRRRDET